MIHDNKATPIVKPPYPLSPFVEASSWKETALITAVALTAIASAAQFLTGSFALGVVYGFLSLSSYLGYEAQTKTYLIQQKHEYIGALHSSAERLKKETLDFRQENTKLISTNKSLSGQVELLETRLKEMQGLLAKVDASATLTKELLNSCVEVAGDQKNTEKRISSLLTQMEKGSSLTTQKAIEKHVKALEQSVGQMDKQIKDFFLRDTRAEKLLEVKKEFDITSRDLRQVKQELQKVQLELSDTSSRLQKNSFDIDRKVSDFSHKESRLNLTQKLTPLTLSILKKPGVSYYLSKEEKRQVKALEEHWNAFLALP